ncbi:MAG: helix-turn-helix domain-containing protein [Bacteriovorax sp.]
MNIQLLTVKQLAEYLKISPKTIYNKVSLEKIPFVKAGGSLRFVLADIEKWLKSSDDTK